MIPSGASPGRDSCTHERRGEKEIIPSLISGASPGRDSCTHDYLEAHPWEGIHVDNKEMMSPISTILYEGIITYLT